MIAGELAGHRLRRTVLRLAAAHPEDRHWILARLSAPARERIDALLAEIDGLGIEHLSSLIADAAARWSPGENECEMPAMRAEAILPWLRMLRDDGFASMPLDHDGASVPTASIAPEAGNRPALPPALRQSLQELLGSGNERATDSKPA